MFSSLHTSMTPRFPAQSHLGVQGSERESTMELTAIFESLFIGDGTYPPLHKGQLVNLSFEITPKRITETFKDTPERFNHLGSGEYSFCGEILKTYPNADDPSGMLIATSANLDKMPFLISSIAQKLTLLLYKVFRPKLVGTIIIVKASDFSFYILSYESKTYTQGSKIAGIGTLLLDHYTWVECLSEYKDPPNLFYNLQVKRIRKVQIPDKFVEHYEDGKSKPTRLEPNEYSASDVEEIETMIGQPFDEEFYIIDFDTNGVENAPIKRTFIEP